MPASLHAWRVSAVTSAVNTISQGRWGLGANAEGGVEPAHDRHLEVAHNHVIRRRGGGRNRFLTIAHHAARMAEVRDHSALHQLIDRIVFGHEDA